METQASTKSPVDCTVDYLELLVEVGREAGLDAVGVAGAEPFTGVRSELERRRNAGLHGGMQFTYRNPERSTTPTRILSSARSLVVGTLRTAAPRLSEVTTGRLRIAAYARHDYYATLREALGRVAGRLEADGWQARVVADDNALVDRAAAVRAGIGWYGKNANILIPGRGSWFVLGSVVTDAPLPEGQPMADGCGSCQRCLDSCPTGAIVAPGVVDARRCLAWLVQAPGAIPVEFRESIGGRLYGCDDCQEVCPVGRSERDGEDFGTPAADREASEILSASDEELLEDFGAWYIADRDPRYLRRNALVAMANLAPIGDGQAAALVGHYLSDPDPLLRAHAVWAAARIGRSDLLGEAGDEPDPAVREEIERVVGRGS
ncbi:MAG: tRNA epoxyqueuosine(34) reductase QueG [Actinomycetota bacterium]|nr:tRNA epoxyqueuosine(34) reductase QueG [Actinomycetota bacterium]